MTTYIRAALFAVVAFSIALPSLAADPNVQERLASRGIIRPVQTATGGTPATPPAGKPTNTPPIQPGMYDWAVLKLNIVAARNSPSSAVRYPFLEINLVNAGSGPTPEGRLDFELTRPDGVVTVYHGPTIRSLNAGEPLFLRGQYLGRRMTAERLRGTSVKAIVVSSDRNSFNNEIILPNFQF